MQFYIHNLVGLPNSGDTGALNTFGVEPWWYFFVNTIVELAPLLSIFFVISIFVFWSSDFEFS